MFSFPGEFFFSFHFTRSVVEGNHSLMGGSGDALHLGRYFHFFLFGPSFAFFLVFGCFWVRRVFSATPWGVSQGLGTKLSASGVRPFLLERPVSLTAPPRAHQTQRLVLEYVSLCRSEQLER